MGTPSASISRTVMPNSCARCAPVTTRRTASTRLCASAFTTPRSRPYSARVPVTTHTVFFFHSTCPLCRAPGSQLYFFILGKIALCRFAQHLVPAHGADAVARALYGEVLLRERFTLFDVPLCKDAFAGDRLVFGLAFLSRACGRRPAQALFFRTPATMAASSSGERLALWSGPGRALSSVKCFSITTAPSAAAAMSASMPAVWSE